MAFLTVGETPVKYRRLYLMRIILPSGMVVHKFGVASGNSSKERMLQICGSIFDKFRETPRIKLLRDRKVEADIVFKYENILHRFFSEYRYESKHKFDGITECFVLPDDGEDAIMAYEAVIDSQVPDHDYEAPPKPEDIDLPF